MYINAGIIGNDLPENIDDIEKNFKLFPGSEFVIIFTLDDVENKTKQESNSKTKKDNNFFNLVKNNFFISRVNHFLRTKSYSYLWIKGLATNPSKRYFEESLQNYKENDNINYFAKKIEEMKIFQKMNSINITFVILPYEYQTRNNCKKNNCLGTECFTCCEEQLDRKKYPNLKSPDYIFKNDGRDISYDQ